MCMAKIIAVFHSDVGLQAYKESELHPWSVDLDRMAYEHKWELATPRIIINGGGPGCSYEESGSGYHTTKYVSTYMNCSRSTVFHGAHLSGWHAHIRPRQDGWVVRLRGIIYVSAYGEVSGSEMLVERWYKDYGIDEKLEPDAVLMKAWQGEQL